MQYGMMHCALVKTNMSQDLPQPLQDRHVGCFYHVKNFKESNVQPIEQGMMDQRPCESGILLT